MFTKSLFVLSSAFVATLALAQAPSLGTVQSVQGVVTDTDGTTVSSTTPGEVVRDGERFVTSANGRLTLQLNNGCTVNLRPNQAITIEAGMTCDRLIASISTVGGAGSLAGGSAGTGALGVGALVLFTAGVDNQIDKDNKKNKLSKN